VNKSFLCDVSASGNLITNKFSVINGNSNLKGSSNITGNIYVGGTSSVLGNSFIGGNVSIMGDISYGGNFYGRDKSIPYTCISGTWSEFDNGISVSNTSVLYDNVRLNTRSGNTIIYSDTTIKGNLVTTGLTNTLNGKTITNNSVAINSNNTPALTALDVYGDTVVRGFSNIFYNEDARTLPTYLNGTMFGFTCGNYENKDNGGNNTTKAECDFFNTYDLNAGSNTAPAFNFYKYTSNNPNGSKLPYIFSIRNDGSIYSGNGGNATVNCGTLNITSSQSSNNSIGN
jgi:hypothetical protein